MSALYQVDYHLWVQRQLQLMRARQFDALDVANLVKEVLGLAQRERKELKHLVEKLVRYFLKSQLYPERVSGKWLSILAQQRRRIIRRTEEMPSIVPLLDDYFTQAYEKMATKLALKANLPRSSFAAALPWSKEQLLEDDFMPWTEAERKRKSR